MLNRAPWHLTTAASFPTLVEPLPNLATRVRPFLSRGGGRHMKGSERRQLTRYNLRTPLRFRAIGLSSDKTEHFTEALNVSRGGFYFASSAALQIGMPIEATLRMPIEVTGGVVEETRCTARVVHVRNQPYGDGRIGFGAEIEEFRARQPLGALPVQVDRHAN